MTVVGAAMAAAFGVGFAFVANKPPAEDLATTYLPSSAPTPAPAPKPVARPIAVADLTPPPAPVRAPVEASPPVAEVAPVRPAAAPAVVRRAAEAKPAPAAVLVRGPAPAKRPAPVRVAQTTVTAPPARKVQARTEPLTPDAEWRRSIADYDRQLAEYRNLERDEGYQWARRNDADDDGFCRSAGRRSREFMEGCFEYLDGAGG